MAPRSKITKNMPDDIAQLMFQYQVKDLVNADPRQFRDTIDAFLRLRDHKSEGYSSPSKQRDLSVQFHWGHDHDFG